MNVFIFIVVGFLSFIIGVFGFAQITGSIRCAKIRGPVMAAITLLIWGAVLLGVFFVVRHFFEDYSLALYIAYIISFILTLGTGKNGIE